jgi:hypothetical protein
VPRDQRDLMERPFFSLAKAKRPAPILYETGDVRVEVLRRALAWRGDHLADADILIWAGEPDRRGRRSRAADVALLRFTPYQLLTAIGADRIARLSPARRRARPAAIDRDPHDHPPWRALAATSNSPGSTGCGRMLHARARRGHGIRAARLALSRRHRPLRSSLPSIPPISA